MRNEERAARLELMQLQALTPPPAFGYDIYKTLEGLGFCFDRQEAIDKVRALTAQLREDYDAGKRPVSPTAKRILVTGCPIGGVLDKTVRALEEKGGVAVCFENCSGIKAMHQMVDTEAEDIVTAIAKRYLSIGCAVMTPDSRRMELLAELLKTFQVDGVVEIDLQACTPYCVESFWTRQAAEAAGMPYLALETDYSQADGGQLSTRLEAFLEILE